MAGSGVNEVDGALQGFDPLSTRRRFSFIQVGEDTGGSSLDATEMFDIDGLVSSKWSR